MLLTSLSRQTPSKNHLLMLLQLIFIYSKMFESNLDFFHFLITFPFW